jgi:DNA-binding CsgD family transcriptional regulator
MCLCHYKLSTIINYPLYVMMPNSDNILESIKKELTRFSEGKEVINNSSTYETYIDEFSNNENSIKIILDQVNFKILKVSDNITRITGFSENDFLKFNMRFILKLLTFEHFLFPYTWVKWANEVYQKIGNIDDPLTTCCGMKIKHKDGRIMRLLIRYCALEVLDNGIPAISAFSIDDVSHLMKADFYWCRSEFGKKDDRRIHHIFSTNKKDQPHDIISDREKDVLRLIAQGMESKEIGITLFISSHTVDHHRRNMIARTGVRDTTALVQICRMGGII